MLSSLQFILGEIDAHTIILHPDMRKNAHDADNFDDIYIYFCSV